MKITRHWWQLATFASLSVLMVSYTNMSSAPTFGKGVVLVQPAEGVSDDDLEQIIASHGGRSHNENKAIRLHTVVVPQGAEEKVAEALSHNPKIKFAELDRQVHLEPNMAVNDSYYSSEWHLAKIGAPAAWDVASGSGVIVAVLDTGVDGTHPDLAARMVAGYNYYDNNADTSDIHGHGTMVAGTMAAIGNNTAGVAGVSWNSRIMPMRISDPVGNITYYSIVANCLTWAADHGARVANISYGVNTSSAVATAASYFQSKGGVVFNSAGNSGTYSAQANPTSIISVGATDANDVKASWSTTGPHVDMSAPGVGIWTTTRGGGYGAVNGTSFSSPITAAVAALMLSANPGLSPAQIESILRSTAVDLGTAGRDDLYGSGRVNAAAAVAAAKSTSGSTTTTTTTTITTTTTTTMPAIADTVAPVVQSLSPASGTIVKGNVTISGFASDNIAVSSMKIYIDGVLSASSSSNSVSMSWNTRKVSVGAHTIRVDAKDAAGNLATKSVQVTK